MSIQKKSIGSRENNSFDDRQAMLDEIRVWWLDIGILDIGYWMLDTGCWMLDTGYWILETGYWRLPTPDWHMSRAIKFN